MFSAVIICRPIMDYIYIFKSSKSVFFKLLSV